jgi:hypothetical protein
VVAGDEDDDFLEGVSPKADLTTDAGVTGALVGAPSGALAGAAAKLATPPEEELLAAETLTTPLIVSI